MRILLADDDEDLVAILRFAFQRDGYEVVTAYDGETAIRVFEKESPDLIVLDLNMPKRGGMDVLRELRTISQVPIIVLSILVDEDTVVNALDLGADDYLIKPFRARELRSRARAILRRRQGRVTFQASQQEPMTLGQIRLQPRKREVTVDGRPVHLTRTEFELLYYLALNHDRVIRESDIIAHVWGYDADEGDEVVRITVYRLRRKIESDPSHPRYILNVLGVGYLFQS